MAQGFTNIEVSQIRSTVGSLVRAESPYCKKRMPSARTRQLQQMYSKVKISAFLSHKEYYLSLGLKRMYPIYKLSKIIVMQCTSFPVLEDIKEISRKRNCSNLFFIV